MQSGSAQNNADSNYFLKALRVNSGFFYNPRSEDEYHNHREVTWSNQVSVMFARSIYAGVLVNSVYTWGTDVTDENFFLRGAFIHYIFMQRTKGMGFFELNYMQGDYCTCAPEDPYRKSGLHYVGLGIGIDYPILQSNFYASASFLLHYIVNDIDQKHGYNFPKVGLSYRFGKPRD